MAIYMWREGYEYSYDFRNKSSTDISNAGWIKIGGTLSTSSSGISSPIGADVEMVYPVDLTNAKKIIIESNIIWNRQDNYGGYAVNIGLNSSTSQDVGTGASFSIASSAVYGGTAVKISENWTAVSGNNIGGVAKLPYTPKIVIDLQNKTMDGIIAGYGNSSLTLTDAQVTAIRGYQGLVLYTTQQNYYIQDIGIKIFTQ